MSRAPGRAVGWTLGLLVVLALVVGAVWAGSGPLRSIVSSAPPALGRAECTVTTQDGDVPLTREEAKAATTAVVRGADASAVPGVEPTVMERLTHGPPDDAGPSLRCRGHSSEGLEAQEITPSGLTPRAEAVRDAMIEVFGPLSLGGYAPGGVGHGHGENSTHYDGRAVDVFFRPVTEENRRQGWQLAHWLVAHAEDLDVQYVIFDDMVWGSRSPAGRWHPYNAPPPANEILRHLDHVHVDVVRGESA